MITIVVEDGTGLPEANSYISVDQAIAYAENRGVDLGAEHDKIAVKLITAMDFMECITRFKGKQVSPLQALQWPRKGLYKDGDPLPANVIPKALCDAQAQLVVDTTTSGRPLLSANTEYALKKRILGPLTQEWATGSGTIPKGADPHPRFWSLLTPYLNGAGGGVIR